MYNFSIKCTQSNNILIKVYNNPNYNCIIELELYVICYIQGGRILLQETVLEVITIIFELSILSELVSPIAFESQFRRMGSTEEVHLRFAHFARSEIAVAKSKAARCFRGGVPATHRDLSKLTSHMFSIFNAISLDTRDHPLRYTVDVSLGETDSGLNEIPRPGHGAVKLNE